jgi:hypothetical protein
VRGARQPAEVPLSEFSFGFVPCFQVDHWLILPRISAAMVRTELINVIHVTYHIEIGNQPFNFCHFILRDPVKSAVVKFVVSDQERSQN